MATNYVLGPSAARKLTALLRGSGEVTRRPSAGTALAFGAEFAAPFAVRWAQSVNDGKGAWIIWLPSEKLVVTAVGPLDPAKSLTAVGGDYPEGWYLLDNTMLDKDKGGTLYLCIALGKTETATFAASPAGASTEEYDVEICTAAVNSTTGERTVKQFVSSAIVLGTGDDTDTQYGADGKSISLADSFGSDSAARDGHHFYLNGFGKFTVGGNTDVHGNFVPAGDETIELDGDETEFAVLCRTGNKEEPNANGLSYNKLRFVGAGGSSPFQYVKSTTVNSSTKATVTTHKLVNCGFYWDGQYKSFPDFDVSGLLGGGSVFLRGTQAEPSPSLPDPAWEWSLGTSAQSAPSGGKVLNLKLYDFAQSKVAIDYRTTFLALADHTQKARVVAAKPNGGAAVELDATGDGGSIRLATSELEGGEEIAVREVTVKGEDGEDKTVKVLASEDFALDGAASGVTSVNGADGEVSIIGGTNISVTISGKTITISHQDGKEPDEDPNADPCDHDKGGGEGGGVAAGGAGSAGGDADDWVGGVPADGGVHPGDDDCNCD